MQRAFRHSTTVGLSVLGVLACSPALDWRDVRPEGSELTAVFPCRPDRHVRRVELARSATAMHLHVCEADGLTFALAFADIETPEMVGKALGQLRETAARNIGAPAPQVQAWQLSGMTPQPQAGRLAATGRLPDGAPVRLQAVFFAKGLRVYQATVMGAALRDEAVEPFLAGLRLPS